MSAMDPGGRVLTWLGIIRRRPVVLSSPRPPDECLQRLTAVTTSRGAMSWYLDPRTAVRPDPRFRGDVGRSWIRVARFQAASGRGSFVAWLDAEPWVSDDGGTELRGWIAPPPATAGFLPMVAVVACLASLGLLAAGVAQLVLGHVIGLVPALLFPLPAIAMAAINATGRWSLEQEAAKLVDELNGVLGSTATFPGLPAVPAAAGGNDA
jgi:hypothetical protein